MKIILKDTFVDRLESQIDYMNVNSIESAIKFKDTILSAIESLPQNPYMYRKSIYFNSSDIRDLVVAKCTITYRIKNDVIEIFGFRKFQNTPM